LFCFTSLQNALSEKDHYQTVAEEELARIKKVKKMIMKSLLKDS
jgi:hypothetical protein